jgi:hypothetical protein
MMRIIVPSPPPAANRRDAVATVQEYPR